MKIHAIADLHMPGGLGKTMDVFGPQWQGHLDRVAADWDSRVTPTDLVLVAGDISWAMRLDQALDDLAWLGRRPGQKVLVRGNHDYWWQSIGRVRQSLPIGCQAIQNDVHLHPGGRIAIAGSRMWEIPGLTFGEIFDRQPARASEVVTAPKLDAAENQRIFQREMGRLQRSLQALPDGPRRRIAMLHYPPTNENFVETEVTRLLERHAIEICVFGHLHNLKPHVRFRGSRNGIQYLLTSADALDFRLVELLELPG